MMALIINLSTILALAMFVMFMIQGCRAWELADRDYRRKLAGDEPVGNFQYGFGKLIYDLTMLNAPGRYARSQVRYDKRVERNRRRAKYIKTGVKK